MNNSSYGRTGSILKGLVMAFVAIMVMLCLWAWLYPIMGLWAIVPCIIPGWDIALLTSAMIAWSPELVMLSIFGIEMMYTHGDLWQEFGP